ncbi:amidohydrolase [Pedobacter psychrophilus]|uniref:Amidohydrolase n=1 Tax=Pedobacter psychrophilus TaxID=1826909 RepID=A0A179DKJ3_9SPHI|nr:amidohydrolase family protein [Pedobacter psychrophilus]OAQ41627.1 amidohydrolase [Pedobacter psychrophilus]
MRRFSADFIYTITGNIIPNGIVVTNDDGKILAITDEKISLDPHIERYDGIITPGFINTHCHLELSHLHQKIKKQQGLISFIKDVIYTRNFHEDVIHEAMKKADEQMWQNGIVAVGDISNQSISAEIKQKSKIKYHTFIEMIGLDAYKAQEIIKNAIDLKAQFKTPTSITVHAPYSISKELLKELKRYCKNNENKIAIHLQECEAEAELYKGKKGAFLDFFKDLNINAETFKAQSKNSIQAILPFLPKNQKILFVHNTFTCLKDIYLTKRFELDLFWCFCPNANLYIENTLPKIDFFKHTNYPITIGTDSLASNDVLDILSEIKVLVKNTKSFTTADILKWATINGAQFLGLETDFGSIEVGKTPGLNLLQNLKNGEITDKTTLKKLI